jgi:hypothetical protein
MPKIKSLRPLLVLALLAVPALVAANDGISMNILETDPPSGMVLGAREPLYLRIAYRSDTALRFQAAGYADGAEQRRGAMMNPAPPYPPGDGEAVVWIAYQEAAGIDEVRVQVFDESWNRLDRLTEPMAVRWDGIAPTTRREPAAWARDLSAAQQHMTASGLASTPQPQGFWGGAIITLMVWSIPGYLLAQIYMGVRFRGRWRTAALLPLWIMAPLLGYTLFALFAGSNLWPLMLLFITPFAFLYLLAVLLAKGVWGRAA